MPPGLEPGLAVSDIYQVPTGGTLPTADGRVQMYPCYLVRVPPDPGQRSIPISARRRSSATVIGHDCGTVINPKIVRGMTMGGIAHGIGAALYEEFAYDGEGQIMAQSFMDYLLPSAHEVPPVAHHPPRNAVAAHRTGPEGLGRVRLSRLRRRPSPTR